MDQLLSKDITKVAGLREEIMGMYMCMDKKITGFSKEYEALCNREAQDLAKRQKDAQDTLKNISDKYDRMVQDLITQRDMQIGKLNNDIKLAKQEQNNADNKEDQTYFKWESEYQNSIDKDVEDSHEELRKYGALLNELATVRNRVRAQLNERKYDGIVRSVKPPQCRNINEAYQILYNHSPENCSETERQILNIQSSFLKRILFSGKRNKFCCTLEQMIVDVEYAMGMIKQDTEAWQFNASNQFDLDRKTMRDQMRIAKQNNLQVYKEKEQKANAEIKNTENSFGQKINAVQANRTRDYSQKDQQLKAEFSNAQMAWAQDRIKLQKSFETSMEAEYPRKQCYDMIAALWHMSAPFRPDRFGGSYIAGSEALRNIPVGEQLVNVSRWYQQTNSGPIIKKFMAAAYTFLFRQQAKGGKRICIPEYLYMPFFFSLEKGESIVAVAPDQTVNVMESLLQGVGMRILWSIPAAQSQFLLADAYKIGSFSELAALDPATFNTGGTSSYKSILSGNQSWSSVKDIELQIKDNRVRYNSTGRMGSAESLRAYNVKNPMNVHSFLITLLQKFPAGLSSETLQSLAMLSRDCGKLGYSAIMSGSKSNAEQLDPKLQDVYQEVLNASLIMNMNQNQTFTIKNSPYAFEQESFVSLYPMPSVSVQDQMRMALRQETDRAGSNMIFFEQAKDIILEENQWFSQNSDDGIVVPIGYYDGGEICNIIFDDSRVHTIINGDTGSGKTNFLHILITNTLLRYSPEEVEMYLIDFKHGTEFRKYTNYNLPNFKAISICNEPEFVLQVLQSLQEEIKYRSNQFDAVITSIKSYNRTAAKKMPRIIIILDELYELMIEAVAEKNAAIRTEIMKILKEFAVQSRTYGIHMVISGQNLTEIPEIKTIKNSCNTRIALRCDQNQVESLINKDAGDKMRLINERDKGACVIQPAQSVNPMIEHTAYIDPDKTHVELLEKIHKKYCARNIYGNPRVLTTEVGSNPNNIFMRFLLRNDLSMVNPGEIWIGDSITMKPVSSMMMKEKNLWIAGGNSQESYRAGKSIIFFVLLSCLLHQVKTQDSIILCNGETDSSNTIEMDDRAGELATALKNRIRYATGDQMLSALQMVYQELVKRQNGNGGKDKVWFILKSPEKIITQNQQAMQALQEILLNGPACGIQTVLYTVDPQKLEAMSLNMMPFSEKIALEMDTSFYTKVLASKPQTEPRKSVCVTASNLRIRIYDLPTTAWVERIAAKFGGKQ